MFITRGVATLLSIKEMPKNTRRSPRKSTKEASSSYNNNKKKHSCKDGANCNHLKNNLFNPDSIPKCSKEGCQYKAQQGGICMKHGGKRILLKCAIEGCTNFAQKDGVCMSHGARVKKCKEEGCTNYAKKDGLCVSHGATIKKYICTEEGCANKAQKGGFCRRHGATAKKCSIEGCTNNTQKDGVCKRHGATVKKYICTIEGCTNIAQRRGLCRRHGADIDEVVTSSNIQRRKPNRRTLAIATQAKANRKKREKKNKAAVLVSPPKRVLPSRGAKPKSGTSLITRGTRVKVLFDKSTWYGGVITSVLEGGSRIKIKYDDGEESTLSSGEEDIKKDELPSADMDIDDESTSMDFQDDADTGDWNVEEGKKDDEAATSDERPQLESVSSPQQLVPLDSLVSTTNGRDWVDGETNQDIFNQDDDAVDWSFDDMSAHSSVNSRDRQKKRQEKNQSSDDDLSTNSSIVSGEKESLLEEASIDEALTNDPKHKDTSDDDFGYTSFEADDNSFGLIDHNLDSSDDLGAGDSDYSPIEEDNNTDKSFLDNRNQAALLLQSSRTVQEVSTSQQAIPEYLKTLRRRVGVKKVNVQTDNIENDSITNGKDITLPAHDDIETKREYDQQKDTGDESSAINILASLSSASQSQQPSSQNDHQGIESALMLLASSHSSKDDMGSKDTLATTRKRPSSSEQLPSPKRPRLASDAATTLLAFAKQPIRLVDREIELVDDRNISQSSIDFTRLAGVPLIIVSEYLQVGEIKALREAFPKLSDAMMMRRAKVTFPPITYQQCRRLLKRYTPTQLQAWFNRPILNFASSSFIQAVNGIKNKFFQSTKCTSQSHTLSISEPSNYTFLYTLGSMNSLETLKIYKGPATYGRNGLYPSFIKNIKSMELTKCAILTPQTHLLGRMKSLRALKLRRCNDPNAKHFFDMLSQLSELERFKFVPHNPLAPLDTEDFWEEEDVIENEVVEQAAANEGVDIVQRDGQFDHHTLLSNRILKAVCTNRGLRSLSMRNLEVNEGIGMEPLQRLSNLESLCLSALSSFEGHHLSLLLDVGRESLKKMCLLHCRLLEGELHRLTNMQRIEAISLIMITLCQNDFEALESMSGLERLNIFGRVRDDIDLTRLHRLRHLSLQLYNNVHPDIANQLLHLQSLESLTLRLRFGIEGEQNTTNRIITVHADEESTFAASSGSGNRSVSPSSLSEGSDIDLPNVNMIMTHPLDSIGSLNNLRSLLIYDTLLTDGLVETIGSLPHLVDLSLWDCHALSAVSINHLTSIQALEKLTLHRFDALNESHLEQFLQLKSLNTLELYLCRNLVDANLEQLGSMARLTHLTICPHSVEGQYQLPNNIKLVTDKTTRKAESRVKHLLRKIKSKGLFQYTFEVNNKGNRNMMECCVH